MFSGMIIKKMKFDEESKGTPEKNRERLGIPLIITVLCKKSDHDLALGF
jgi:hypothetical protein